MKKFFQRVISLGVIIQLIFGNGISITAKTIENVKQQNKEKKNQEKITKYSPFTLKSARDALTSFSKGLSLIGHVSHSSHSSHVSHKSHSSHYSSSHSSHYSASILPLPKPQPSPFADSNVADITKNLEKELISVTDWETVIKNIGETKYYVSSGNIKNISNFDYTVNLQLETFDKNLGKISTYHFYKNPFIVKANSQEEFSIVLLYDSIINQVKLIWDYK